MSLPLIFLPPNVPLPLVRGHGQDVDDQFDHVPALQGEGRKRRIYTASNRTAQLIWLLTESQMLVWDEWFEETLDRGVREFACPVAKLGASGIEYWTARFIDPDVDDPIASPNSLWEVSGAVLLTGEPSDTLPDTGALALDTVVSLGTIISLTIDTVVSLGGVEFNGYELREDGGYELREDGGREKR